MFFIKNKDTKCLYDSTKERSSCQLFASLSHANMTLFIIKLSVVNTYGNNIKKCSVSQSSPISNDDIRIYFTKRF